MAEEKAEAAAPKGKGNMIFIVIIAVLATLLIGGGITAVLLLKKSGSHSEQTAEKGEGEKEAEGGHGSEKGGEKGGKGEHGDKEGSKTAPIYVQMEPPFVVNFDASQTVRFLQITVELMTRDAATSTMLKDNNPVLRNDLLMLFGGQDASKLGTREGKEELREKALETVREIVKKEGGKAAKVEAVYFTTFVMQ